MTILDLHHRQRWASAQARAIKALPSSTPHFLGRTARRRALLSGRPHAPVPAMGPEVVAGLPGSIAPRADAATRGEHRGSWEQTSKQRLHHDLRQSVGLLMALTEGVQQNIGHAREVLRRLDQMRQETERMAALVSAQAGTGDQQQRVDVGQVVADSWRSAVAAAPCTMRLVCDAGTHAYLDPVALARSVQNLLDNAVRAAGCDGTVVVQVRHHGDVVTLTVSDTGPGFGNVPAQQGLGLITVRRFVAECGGTLEVTGSARGGAELVLCIPAAGRTGEELTCAS